MKDMILAIRADEAHHRVVNHTLASMDRDQFNPYKPGKWSHALQISEKTKELQNIHMKIEEILHFDSCNDTIFCEMTDHDNP